MPFKQIVADINLDMFLPLYPLKVIEVQGLAESSLGETVRAAAKTLGVDVQTDREPEQNRFIRSDQYSFIRRGVPSLAFKFGYEFGSPEETIRRNWVRDVYHKPTDDLNQPVDLEAAAMFDRVIMTLLQRVANDPARPTLERGQLLQAVRGRRVNEPATPSPPSSACRCSAWRIARSLTRRRRGARYVRSAASDRSRPPRRGLRRVQNRETVVQRRRRVWRRDVVDLEAYVPAPDTEFCHCSPVVNDG